jgi:hypothetical protein
LLKKAAQREGMIQAKVQMQQLNF